MSICDKCVHREVCCDEGMGEEALKFCAHLLEERPKGKWRVYEGIISCENCRCEVEETTPFCPNCGADMRGEA
jgi:hypothetical protein